MFDSVASGRRGRSIGEPTEADGARVSAALPPHGTGDASVAASAAAAVVKVETGVGAGVDVTGSSKGGHGRAAYMAIRCERAGSVRAGPELMGVGIAWVRALHCVRLLLREPRPRLSASWLTRRLLGPLMSLMARTATRPCTRLVRDSHGVDCGGVSDNADQF